MTERLRPEIQAIRISPNGKYVLAQDDSNVFILERKPLKSVFRFDAPDAEQAMFTPDSGGVIVLFAGLGTSPRVERWDLQTRKRTEVHEIYVRGGCLISKIAPDGRTLSCMTLNTDSGLKFDLDLYDVASGNSFFHKKGFVTLLANAGLALADLQLIIQLENGSQKSLDRWYPAVFSPDGHYFVAHSRQNNIAVDLISRTEINLPGNFKGLLDENFIFLPDGHFMGVAGSNGEKSSVVEFPSGRVIYKDINVGGSRIYPQHTATTF